MALFTALGAGFYGGWGPCGPATVEGMILMTVGIPGMPGSGALLLSKALLEVAPHAFQSGTDT